MALFGLFCAHAKERPFLLNSQTKTRKNPTTCTTGVLQPKKHSAAYVELHHGMSMKLPTFDGWIQTECGNVATGIPTPSASGGSTFTNVYSTATMSRANTFVSMLRAWRRGMNNPAAVHVSPEDATGRALKKPERACTKCKCKYQTGIGVSSGTPEPLCGFKSLRDLVRGTLVFDDLQTMADFYTAHFSGCTGTLTVTNADVAGTAVNEFRTLQPWNAAAVTAAGGDSADHEYVTPDAVGAHDYLVVDTKNGFARPYDASKASEVGYRDLKVMLRFPNDAVFDIGANAALSVGELTHELQLHYDPFYHAKSTQLNIAPVMTELWDARGPQDVVSAADEFDDGDASEDQRGGEIYLSGHAAYSTIRVIEEWANHRAADSANPTGDTLTNCEAHTKPAIWRKPLWFISVIVYELLHKGDTYQAAFLQSLGITSKREFLEALGGVPNAVSLGRQFEVMTSPQYFSAFTKNNQNKGWLDIVSLYTKFKTSDDFVRSRGFDDVNIREMLNEVMWKSDPVRRGSHNNEIRIVMWVLKLFSRQQYYTNLAQVWADLDADTNPLKPAHMQECPNEPGALTVNPNAVAMAT
jgi:hypothetical protein